MRVLTAAVILCGMAWFVLVADVYRLDLDVYRIGVQTWLAGGDLYGKLPETAVGISLPFIYPPIAAVMMTPLAVVSFPVASVALTVLTIVLLAVTLTVVLDSLGLSRRWLVLVVPLALAAEPVWSTLGFGQINVLLMALVAADCLVGKPRWPRGMLVGLAAAVKLTPAAFVLFFLLRRDNRAALNAAATFVAVTVTGFLLAWNESIGFWTNEVFQTGEKVGVGFVSNQSILGVLTRTDTDWLWPLFVAVVLVLTIVVMRREPALALAANALAMLLVSPISWSHHWVWCVLTVPAFAMNGMRLLAVTGATLFVIAPHWWVEPEPWEVNAYAIYAVVALTAIALRTRRRNLRGTSLDHSLRRA